MRLRFRLGRGARGGRERPSPARRRRGGGSPDGGDPEIANLAEEARAQGTAGRDARVGVEVAAAARRDFVAHELVQEVVQVRIVRRVPRDVPGGEAVALTHKILQRDVV